MTDQQTHDNQQPTQPQSAQNATQFEPSEPTTANPVKKKSWFARYFAISSVLVVIICVYLGFFSESSVTRGIAYKHTIDSLQACIEEQEDSLAYYRDLNHRLSTDPSLTEQVVREQYNMKRDNEDVFIFEKSHKK